MREEIIPEMMKNPKLNLEGLDEDAEDHNPEWEEWIDRSGITDKLRLIRVITKCPGQMCI